MAKQSAGRMFSKHNLIVHVQFPIVEPFGIQVIPSCSFDVVFLIFIKIRFFQIVSKFTILSDPLFEIHLIEPAIEIEQILPSVAPFGTLS